MPRLRQFTAALLLLLWTPIVSHCLLEVALGDGKGGCCESAGPSEPEHSDCSTCLSVEAGQTRTDPSIMLPAPGVHDHVNDFIPLLFATAPDARNHCARIRRPDDSPPVSPADLIMQATVARPVRGPSIVRA